MRFGCLLLAATACAATPEQFFNSRVAPILTRRCLPCHNNQLNNAGISFQTPVTVPLTLVLRAVRGEGRIQMPPGPTLRKREIAILNKWVQDGAIWGNPLK